MHSFLSVMRVLAQKDDRTTVAGKHGSAQQLEKLKMPHCGTCPMLTCMKVHWLFCDFEPRSWSTRCLSTVAASTLLPRVGTDGQTRWAVAQKMMTTKYSGYCCRFAPIKCIESCWIQLNHIFACASGFFCTIIKQQCSYDLFLISIIVVYFGVRSCNHLAHPGT